MSEFAKGGSSEVEDRCGLMSFYSLCFPSSVSETTHTLSVACAHSSLLCILSVSTHAEIIMLTFLKKNKLEKQETLEITLYLHNLLLA